MNHTALMELALAEAEAAIGLSDPNPRVGCVLADAAGQVIGKGHTQQAGGPHAEVMALRDAASRGHATQGATAYVTLEPCSHHGRTGPCCDALVAAGISRVVASLTDPNPLVAGQGFARLRTAGIPVEVGPGAEPSRELNIGFFSRMVRGMPWVRAKVAASLDGQTALRNGESRWITSEAARTDGHAWRARASAILTGMGTVAADDPQLDVRHVPVARQPSVVVVDTRLELPPTARLLRPNRDVLVYTAASDNPAQHALQAQGALVVPLPDGAGRVDLAAVLGELARRGVNELHVEAGHRLTGALLQAGLVDELLCYLAPRLVGPGQGMVHLGPIARLEDAVNLQFRSVQPVGPDLRILARLPGRDSF